jgi:hypothetical protein
MQLAGLLLSPIPEEMWPKVEAIRHELNLVEERWKWVRICRFLE